jgi:hypothetical protein
MPITSTAGKIPSPSFSYCFFYLFTHLTALIAEIDASSFCFFSHQVWQDIEEYIQDGGPTGAKSRRAIEGMKEQHFVLPFSGRFYLSLSLQFLPKNHPDKTPEPLSPRGLTRFACIICPSGAHPPFYPIFVASNLTKD